MATMESLNIGSTKMLRGVGTNTELRAGSQVNVVTEAGLERFTCLHTRGQERSVSVLPSQMSIGKRARDLLMR